MLRREINNDRKSPFDQILDFFIGAVLYDFTDLDASRQYLYRLQYKSLGHIRFLYNHACFVPYRVKERHPGNCSREQGKKI